ncbi:MAG TPA: DegV family protein [Symbiobacteriaceae bacterium]|jgi:DegV family protein with EDD domain
MANRHVRILCDSCADLPRSLAEQHQIVCVPLTFSFGKDVFRDQIDMQCDEFYTKLKSDPRHPNTSQITPAEYEPFFREATADGGEAVYIGLSSGLSGSLQNATLVAAGPEFGGRIRVVDSLGASIGYGLMVLRAADLAAAGTPAGEIVTAIESLRDRMCHVFTLDTLEYAHRGGRVSAFSAAASRILDVKPVLHMDMAGKLVAIDRVRGRKKALNRLFGELERLGANPAGQRVGVCHAAAESEALDAAERFKTQYGAAEVVVAEIGPVIGTHTGPGCVSIFFEGPVGRGE